MYGLTSGGGASNLGTIFKIKPDGTSYTNLLNFSGASNGSTPDGSLISDGTFLYGMTALGGTSSLGTIFKIKPDGTAYTKLLDFSGTNGNHPDGTLFYDGVYLYGMTYQGGLHNFGVLFRIRPDETGYLDILDFDNVTSGSKPAGSLFYDGTYLYGVTQHGGASGFGTVFKIMPNGTGYTTLLSFTGTNGEYPYYGKLVSDGTFLYGVTADGGASNLGVVYKIKTDGTAYAKLLDFTGTVNGSVPTGQLYYDGSFLYGMSSTRGANNFGVIFQIKTDGTAYSDLFDFSGTLDGNRPLGGFISDGLSIYGVTYQGGANNDGVFFKFHAAGMGVLENNNTINCNVYPNPTSEIVNIEFENVPNKGKIQVYNSLGQVIHLEEIENNSTEFKYIINLSSQPKGVYFVHLQTEKGETTKKIVLIGN